MDNFHNEWLDVFCFSKIAVLDDSNFEARKFRDDTRSPSSEKKASLLKMELMLNEKLATMQFVITESAFSPKLKLNGNLLFLAECDDFSYRENSINLERP